MQPPTSLKLLQGFIGMINYYRGMWPHRSHILALLTAKTGAPKNGEKPSPFQWILDMQKAFGQTKPLMAADVLCAYPDHNKPFHVITASLMHLIINLVHASCMKASQWPQMNYATIDKDFLCVVATLRKFCSMLLGAELHAHTDHQNILRIGDSSQQRLFWISYVDEYGPELHFVEGPRNMIADTFSRLLCSDMCLPLVGKKAAYVDSNSESGNRYESSHSLLIDDRDITDCLMNLPFFPSRKKRKGNQQNAESVPNQYRMKKTNPSCCLTLRIPL
jgi:hypothetical protein